MLNGLDRLFGLCKKKKMQSSVIKKICEWIPAQRKKSFCFASYKNIECSLIEREDTKPLSYCVLKNIARRKLFSRQIFLFNFLSYVIYVVFEIFILCPFQFYYVLFCRAYN